MKRYAVSMPVVILKEKHTQSFLQPVVKGLEDDVGMMLWNAPVSKSPSILLQINRSRVQTKILSPLESPELTPKNIGAWTDSVWVR